MPRILAIDYGTQRVGLAVTDTNKIIASALDTIPTGQVIDFLKKYCSTEPVELFVIGLPLSLKGQETDASSHVAGFVRALGVQIPEIPIQLHDERFSSKMAVASMIVGGMKKKDRQIKANVDKISATIILQSFMDSKFPF